MAARGFVPRNLLRAGVTRNQFGRPVRRSRQVRSPRSIPPGNWVLPAGRDLVHLRAAVAQSHWACLTVIALDFALSSDPKVGAGTGQGTRRTFAQRIGISPYRLSRVFRGHTMMDAIDFGVSASIPNANQVFGAFTHMPTTVQGVLKHHYLPPRNAQHRDSVTWPVSQFERADRAVVASINDWPMDGRDGYRIAAELTAEDELALEQLQAAAAPVLEDYLHGLWTQQAAANSWPGPAPEPDIDITMYRRGTSDPEVGFDAIVMEDGISAVLTLPRNWPTSVGALALIDGTFVLEIQQWDERERAARVLAARAYPHPSDDLYNSDEEYGAAQAVVGYSHDDPDGPPTLTLWSIIDGLDEDDHQTDEDDER